MANYFLQPNAGVKPSYQGPVKPTTNAQKYRTTGISEPRSLFMNTTQTAKNLLSQSGKAGATGDLLGVSSDRSGSNKKKSNDKGGGKQPAQPKMNTYGTDELKGISDEYDMVLSDFEGDLKGVENDYNAGLKEMEVGQNNYLSSANLAKEETNQQGDTQMQDALTTAQETIRQNRNTLRALGILSSSAAGNMLSQPMQQYDKVRSTILQNTTNAVRKIDLAIQSQKASYEAQKNSFIKNYQNVVANIKKDMRWTASEKAQALKQAKAALSDAVGNLTTTNQQITSDMTNYRSSLAADAEKINSAQSSASGYDYSKDFSPSFDFSQARSMPSQVGVEQEKKNYLSGF